MIRIYITILFTVLLCTYVNCQDTTNYTITGLTINDSNNEKLEYVNIGIIKKNFGTISDLEGRFNLSIPDSLINDTLSFSYIGFESLQVPILKLLDSANLNISLKRKNEILEEITIYAKKTKIKKYGTKGHSPLGFVPAYIDKDIYEIAFLVKPRKIPAKLKNLNLYIHNSSVDSCIFRINIYDNSEGYPSEKINVENIIIRTSIIKRSWKTIDLTKYKLVFNSDFYVSIEFIPDFKDENPYQIGYGAKIIKGGKTYIRKSSLGEWEIDFFNISFNVDLIH